MSDQLCNCQGGWKCPACADALEGRIAELEKHEEDVRITGEWLSKAAKGYEQRIAELEAKLKRQNEIYHRQRDMMAEYEAKLDRVRELPEKWREGEFEAMSPDCDYIEDLCADQLEAVLKDEDE